MHKLTRNIVLSVRLKSMINYFTYTNTRDHRCKIFIVRTHKLVLSKFFFNRTRITLIWNALPNTCFAADKTNMFKHTLLNFDIKGFCKEH